MCGIVGIYNRDGAPADPRTLLRMRDVQRHRGPDDEGAVLFSLTTRQATPLGQGASGQENGAYEGAVGFNRLSILDLSANGHQPMWNASGTVFIGFNGEIYNAFQHRPELQAAGFHFRSNTDTEVLLYLYERDGWRGMLERLNGMFALCLVDLPRQRIYLARDHFGVKPLYWAECGATVLFASEVKSFLYHPGFRARLDEDRLDEYFTFRYCAESGFLLRDVKQVEPGHWICLGPGGREQRRYWCPGAAPGSHLTLDEAVDGMEAHLRRSVRMQLLSDVKVGCQLSGGIDSSLVSVFAAQQSGVNLDAFSIEVDAPRFSEARWIEEATRVAGVRNHPYTLDARYFADHAVEAGWHLDEPIGHPNSIGILALAEAARPIVTVLLSGEGADEVLGGYTRFAYALLRSRMQPLLPLLGHMPGIGSIVRRKFGGIERLDDVDWFLFQSAQNPLYLQRVRPQGSWRQAVALRREIFDKSEGDFISRCFAYETSTYLVNLLVRQDKMTMARSVENRVPFLDPELVAFVRGLPVSYLVAARPGLRQLRMRNTKIVLKRLALKYFRSGFVYRPKLGFNMPLASFLSGPAFRPLMEEALLPGMAKRGIVRADVVRQWWRRAGGVSHDALETLWACLAFELWCQLFLDRTLAPPSFTPLDGSREPGKGSESASPPRESAPCMEPVR